MRMILDLLKEPSMDGLDVNGEERFLAHAQALRKKPLLRKVFVDFHHLFHTLDRKCLSGGGMRVELGAGVAPIRDSYPDVLATDVVFATGLDRTLDAENMDLGPESVRTIFGQNCFHHFPHPERFFHELQRVLVSGGGCILIEPYYGSAATFLFKRLFRTEGYDKRYPSWEAPVEGPMSGANQALSYIVFVRDRGKFETLFPSLEIVHMRPCDGYLRYLLSGGLNFRQLCPDWSNPLIDAVEWLCRPLRPVLALHHIVVIRKKT